MKLILVLIAVVMADKSELRKQANIVTHASVGAAIVFRYALRLPF